MPSPRFLSASSSPSKWLSSVLSSLICPVAHFLVCPQEAPAVPPTIQEPAVPPTLVVVSGFSSHEIPVK